MQPYQMCIRDRYSYDGVKYGADGDQAAQIVAVEGYSNGVRATNRCV